MVLGTSEMLGMGLQFGGGLLGMGSASKAAKQQERMFKQALSQYREAQSQARGQQAAAQAQIRGAQAQAREATKAAERRMTAGEQRAQTLAKERSKQMQAQRTQTAFGRGQMGTTLGMAASQGMLRDVGLLGANVAAQGAAQRAQMQQQLGGQLAGLSAQRGQMYAAQAGQTLQSAGQLAQLMGSYQPIVDTSMSQMLGGLGGQLFGAGAFERLMGGGQAGSPAAAGGPPAPRTVPMGSIPVGPGQTAPFAPALNMPGYTMPSLPGYSPGLLFGSF
jgi:hypothetical protein